MKPAYRDTDSPDTESLLSHSSSHENLTHHTTHKQPLHRRHPTLTLTALLLSTHICTAIIAIFFSQSFLADTVDVDTTCALLTSHASPVSTEVDIHWAPVTYNGSFFHATAFRGDASPATDAAWSSLGVDYRALRVEASEAAAAGLGADTHVSIRQEYGGGFPANVEGLHHLHCLNLLRQGLVYNYDYYKALGKGAFQNEEPVVKTHITHCLDIIRQQLMCTVDTGVLGQVWWDPSSPKPFVDFNTQHMCKNFDAIRQWAEERQLPANVPVDFLAVPQGKVYDEIP